LKGVSHIWHVSVDTAVVLFKKVQAGHAHDTGTTAVAGAAATD
jgi:hypothetical protein